MTQPKTDDLAGMLEDDADASVEREELPDWEELGELLTKAEELKKAKKLTRAEVRKILDAGNDAIPKKRADVRASFAEQIRALFRRS